MNKLRNIIWGAGHMGKLAICFLKMLDVQIDGVVDNSIELWGTELCGLMIAPPGSIDSVIDELKIFIACKKYKEIILELKKKGVNEKQVVIVDELYSPEFLMELSDRIWDVVSDRRKQNKYYSSLQYDIIIDLSGGMVLGGVESWSIQIAKELRRFKQNAVYVMPNTIEAEIDENTLPKILISAKEIDYVLNCVGCLAETAKKKILANFPADIMQAACIVKKNHNSNMNIIMIIHNDHELYYRAAKTWQEWIDFCFVISSSIREKLLSYGFPEDKVRVLEWVINQNEYEQNEADNKPIRIGYAGRIIIAQKRSDLLLEISKLLTKRGIRFRLQIAGDGEFREELEKQICVEGLQQSVELLGCLEHDKMEEFWKRQDICIGVSEYEGRSISQSEAMAAGTALVITDTSGARENVVDGYNGYIVPVGEIEKMVDKLAYLSYARPILQKMKKASYDIIKDRNVAAIKKQEDLIDLLRV